MISGPCRMDALGVVFGATKMRPRSTPGLEVRTVMDGGTIGAGSAAGAVAAVRPTESTKRLPPRAAKAKRERELDCRERCMTLSCAGRDRWIRRDSGEARSAFSRDGWCHHGPAASRHLSIMKDSCRPATH